MGSSSHPVCDLHRFSSFFFLPNIDNYGTNDGCFYGAGAVILR